jgi:hypothetical protein
VSRLRRLLGTLLAARPYRLLADVSADFKQVEELLEAGDVAGALRAYRAPLLVESEVQRIAQAREELESSLRHAALTGGDPDLQWAWLQTEGGLDDFAGLEAFVRTTGPEDARHAVATARLRALRARWWDGDGEPAAMSGLRPARA